MLALEPLNGLVVLDEIQRVPDLFLCSAGVDTITISFLVSGMDASGTKKHFARQIVIQGEELQMPQQQESIVSPRRRPARR